MAIYAIGDVQGCREPLERLLATIDFSKRRDTLWFVGDLVNRGPDSAGVLRLVRDLGDAAVTVLGNHDLHLLGRAFDVRRARRSDTLAAVLRASDGKDLVEWLRHRPFLHRGDGHVLVHAGFAPEWSVTEAAALAREVEAELRGEHAAAFVDRACGSKRWGRWRPDAQRAERLSCAARFLTRVRCVRSNGAPDDDFSGPPDAAPEGLTPWFETPGQRRRRTPVVFGHWAALGLRLTRNALGIDTGCVWGKALTAVRLGDRAVFQATVR